MGGCVKLSFDAESIEVMVMNLINKIYNIFIKERNSVAEEEVNRDAYNAYADALYMGNNKIRQEVACMSPEYAYYFACDVDGANIEKCQGAVLRDPYWAYLFAIDVKGADIKRCMEACKGSELEDKLGRYLMEAALR